MLSKDRRWIVPAVMVVSLLLWLQLGPQPVQAQCGTQASSCKNCHEVQAKDPVNTKGAWHTDHAFGDFCEYCHAGNVQAMDETTAHQGLEAWNADIKASCASCHATDYEKRAQIYATELGVSLNVGGTATGTATAATGSAPAAAGSVTVTGPSAVCPPQGGEEIDLNLLYAQHFTPPPLVSNWGNVILGIMSLGVGAVFFGTAWTWQGWGRKVAGWIRNNVTPISEAVADVSRRAEDGADETAGQDDAGDSGHDG